MIGIVTWYFIEDQWISSIYISLEIGKYQQMILHRRSAYIIYWYFNGDQLIWNIYFIMDWQMSIDISLVISRYHQLLLQCISSIDISLEMCGYHQFPMIQASFIHDSSLNDQLATSGFMELPFTRIHSFSGVSACK